jgi:rifampin ADP-ribosylating transferase
MTAHDNLSQPQFFHGSAHDFSPGDVIDPAQSHESVNKSTPSGHAAFTTNSNKAETYGHMAAAKSTGEWGKGHVYQVEPTGSYEKDTGGNAHDSFLTSNPIRVLGKNR